MPQCAFDVEKPLGRRLRVRVDIYKRHPRRLFRPVRRQSIMVTVEGRAEHRAMFRALKDFMQAKSWKKDIRPEDERAEAGDED